MTLEQTRRLKDIRSRLMLWSAIEDTSTWEATFFFKVLDEKNREIAELRRATRQKSLTH